MFSQRRKKYKNMVWACVLTAVAILALVALLGYLGSFRDKTYSENNVSEPVAAQEHTETMEEDNHIEENDDDDDSAPAAKKQTYYLLKYDNDIIRIYFSDQQGELTELEETDIVYETLSPEDQKQFRDGIQVENRDALNRLLMDYES
ncbi:MAG: hypothetical protein IKJ77_08100 [Firmicutes bacterium]|nr:hypothetical protein [Bacillota bacterium]